MRLERPRNGFTLIEVLIVVAIVAVLAAVLIPRVSSSTDDAKESSLGYNVKVMREQAQIYRAHHLGAFPEIRDNALPQLTGATDLQGQIGEASPDYPFGPYVKEALPVNPFDQSNKVTRVAVPGQKPTGVVGSLGGWQYDPSNGTFWPNHPGYYKGPGGSAEATAQTAP
jgi:general secretion pathway protein G